MTRRFDRHGSSGRHHIQTLCAMQHLDYKLKGVHAYEQFFLTMAQLGLPYEDRVEGFRRMVFNVAGMNCDDHVKNLSFLLPEDDPTWRLAPAYDLTFAHNPQGEWTHQHLMSVNGKFKQIERADLLSVADRFGIRRADRLIDEVQEAVQLWPVYADAAGVPDAEIAFIERQLVRLA
jgi:serine/threonine-protein kinase HipA